LSVSYGGNFYAIVDPQENFTGVQDYTAAQLIKWSPIIRDRLNERYDFVHPLDDNINGLSHLVHLDEVMIFL